MRDRTKWVHESRYKREGDRERERERMSRKATMTENGSQIKD